MRSLIIFCVVVWFVFLAGGGSAICQENNCLEYSNYFHLTGGVHTYCPGRALVHQDNLIYLAMSSHDHGGGIAVIDVSDPENPQLLGESTIEWPCTSITISDSIAILGTNKRCGIGGFSFWASAIQAFDISDPSLPEPLSLLELPSYVSDVAISKGHVLAACNGQQFVVDYSDPLAPAIVDSLNLAGTEAFEINGSVLYAANDANGLQILDISALPVTETVANLPTPYPARIAELAGPKLFLAGKACGLPCGVMVVDVAEAADPSLLASVEIGSLPYSLTCTGNQLFFAHETGIAILDVNGSRELPVVAELPRIVTRGLAVTGDLLHVASSGLFTFDFTNTEFVPSLGQVSCSELGNGLITRGSLAYLVHSGHVLQVVDLADPDEPLFRGSCGLSEIGQGICLSGSLAYVASDLGGLDIVDISDPDSPTLIRNVGTTGLAWDVAVAGDHAYVAIGFDGLSVIDVGNPEGAVRVATLDLPGIAKSVAVVGDQVLVGCNADHSVKIIDVSTPASPVLVGSIPTNGYAVNVRRMGDHVLIGDSQGLTVYPAEDILNAVPMAVVNLPAGAYRLAVKDNLAMVGTAGSGIAMIDLTVPAEPRILGWTQTPQTTRDVAVADNCILTSDTEGRVMTWATPCGLTQTTIPDNPMDGSTTMHAPWPNPFNPRVMISFSMKQEGPANVAIYNLQGRLVRELAQRHFDAGTHTLAWDGIDDQGRALPTGVYLARLVADQSVGTRKLVLVR